MTKPPCLGFRGTLMFYFETLAARPAVTYLLCPTGSLLGAAVGKPGETESWKRKKEHCPSCLLPVLSVSPRITSAPRRWQVILVGALDPV